MPKFTITASDGEQLAGYLPESWAEVPLSPYAALALTAQPLPAGLVPTVHPFAHPAGRQALATLLGLPTAEPLHANPSLLADLFEAAPWLFVGPLPDAPQPAPSFTHQGVAYSHLGLLDSADGATLETLLTLLHASEGQPLNVAPQLLAALYRPTGQPVTADTTRQAAAAFATLPLSLAWPALQAFLVRSAPMVLAFQKYGTARQAAGQALRALETAAASPTSAPRGCCSNMLRWLVRHWIKRVGRQLRTFSPPSASTAAPMRLASSPHLPPAN